MHLVTNYRKLQPYQLELSKSSNFLNRFLKVRSLLYMRSYTVMHVNVFITKCLNNRKYKSESVLFVLSAVFTLLSRANTVSSMLHIFWGSILLHFYTFVSHIMFEQIWDPMNILMCALLYLSVCLWDRCLEMRLLGQKIYTVKNCHRYCLLYSRKVTIINLPIMKIVIFYNLDITGYITGSYICLF